MRSFAQSAKSQKSVGSMIEKDDSSKKATKKGAHATSHATSHAPSHVTSHAMSYATSHAASHAACIFHYNTPTIESH